MGALRRTDDMVVIDNSGLSSDQTLEKMLEVAAEKFPRLLAGGEKAQ